MNDTLPIDRITSSMISSYLECPPLFYYQYIAKIHLPQKQQHLLFGSAIHKALEMLYRGDPNPYEWFDRTLDINKLLDDEKKEYPNLLKLGHEMIKNYIAQKPMLDKMYGFDKGSCEQYIKRTLIHPFTGQLSTVPMSGVLDKLTEGGIIVDFKTASQKWNPNSAAMRVQTLMYSLWYYSEYNELPESVIYCVLLKKFKQHKHDQVIQIVETHVTLDDLAIAFEEVELIVEKIRQGIFDGDPKSYGYFAKQELRRYEEALALEDDAYAS